MSIQARPMCAECKGMAFKLSIYHDDLMKLRCNRCGKLYGTAYVMDRVKIAKEKG